MRQFSGHVQGLCRCRSRDQPRYPCQVKIRGKTSTSKANPRSPFYKREFPKEFKRSENDMTQKQARVFLPPGCSIWRSNYRGACLAQIATPGRIAPLAA